MMEVTKRQNGNGYDHFSFQTEEGIFYITFCGNLDLYWGYDYQGNLLKQPETHTFFITKENYYVYSMFEKLYNDVINGNVYDDMNEEEKDIFINHIISENNPESLVQDGVICWHSDDYSYENASSVSIEKLEDEFAVTFQRSKQSDEEFIMSYAVRFRNSGSRYAPFNCIFMKMYLELKNYDPDYHQIHMEETQYKPKARIRQKED